MQRFRWSLCLGAGLLAALAGPVVVQAQEKEQVSRRSDSSPKLTEAAKRFAREVAGDDEAEYIRVLVDALKVAQERDNRRRAESLLKQLEKQEAIIRDAEEKAELLRALLNPQSNKPQALTPLPETEQPTEVSKERAMPSGGKRPGGPKFAANDFAPRATAGSSGRSRSFTMGTDSSMLFWKNSAWQQNMLSLIDERGSGVSPRIFNPHDDETKPTMDMLDCVSIGRPGQSCCTGTLIRPNVVLSAGHCLPCDATHVYVGWNANRPSTGKVYEIADIVRHESYDNPNRFNNDIALIFLSSSVPNVKPRDLATTQEITQAKSFLAVGFGHTDQGNFGIKFEAPVAVQQRYRYELTAGGFGFDTCQGDSGGPIYFEPANGSRFRVAGVTSRGNECGQGGIYVRVDAYKTWIESTIDRRRGSSGRSLLSEDAETAQPTESETPTKVDIKPGPSRKKD